MTEKKALSAADILSASDIITEAVDVPEWNGHVLVRNLSAEEAIRFVKENEGTGATAVSIVALCAVDDDGKRLFTADQVEELKKKSFRAILRIQAKALELNGLSGEGVAAAKND